MAAMLSLPQLSLDLPNTRMSVDFSTFVGSQSTSASHHITSRAKITRRPLPSTSQVSTVAGIPLPEIQEEPSENLNTSTAPSRQNSLKWPWRKLNDNPGQSNAPLVALVRTGSNASTASTTSTAVSSVFSHAQSTPTRSTSSHTLYSTPSIASKDVAGLSNLPLSLLEHILSFALSLPLQVSIGPDASDTHHLSHRYHPAGLDYVDLRRILKHPLFFVSHHIREVSLDVLYRKSEFVIDLHKIYHSKVSSTINENLKKHQKFWMSGTPQVVVDALPNLYRLHLRLPVPSTEAASYRGRDEDDWMIGSDGKGGGNWKVKSMKREQDDALQIQKCVNAIKKLLMAVKQDASQLRPLSRSRSALSLRRTKSSKGTRSRSADNVEPRSGSPANNGGKREPMKRLEITLVKRSPWALVLPESLELIRTFRSVPVSGFTRYHFELNGQRFLWAAKLRKKWQGIEPDGPKLLQDLQSLTIADPPIEPIQTPTDFKFVKVDRRGQLRLLDTALPKTPIVLETPQASRKDLPSVPPVLLKAMAWTKKQRERKDSFTLMMEEGIKEIGSSGTTGSGGRMKAPTIDELRQIAEDIKNGLY